MKTDRERPMEHDRIQYELKNGPSLKLLRSDSAPLILSFLYEQFKHSHRISIPHGEMEEKLEDCLERLNERQPGLYPRTAQAYLETWCDDDHRFLRKYYGANSDDPLFELTPGTEKAIEWIEELNRSRFIGAESRFLRIFGLLEEIVTRSTEDAATRLAQLERQKEGIEKEIEAIREAGRVEPYNVTQIKERFIEANSSARRLLADFREVEQNFRDITRSVQEQQLKEGVKKGSVVGYVLDEHNALKESDQGRSFYAFWNFLMSPSRQEELRGLLDAVYGLSFLEDLSGENQVLGRIKTSLMEAGEKVIQSNHRLAEQLRKMLDERNLSENRRVQELITEIKKLGLTVLEDPPADEDFMLIEGRPAVRLVMEKPFWEPPDLPEFCRQPVEAEGSDLSRVDMRGLYSRLYVDEEELKERLAAVLVSRRQVSLAEITVLYPISKGLSEVIAYFSIAALDKKNFIDDQVREEIALYKPCGTDECEVLLALPRIVFNR